MPMRAPWICGCGYKIAGGAQCPCQRARPSARQRGYTRDWERAAAAFLARPENRYCACGCGRRADTVDHKTAHGGSRTLFWDRSNWQPMAFSCHNRKTASRDGGFGNPRQPAVRP